MMNTFGKATAVWAANLFYLFHFLPNDLNLFLKKSVMFSHYNVDPHTFPVDLARLNNKKNTQTKRDGKAKIISNFFSCTLRNN